MNTNTDMSTNTDSNSSTKNVLAYAAIVATESGASTFEDRTIDLPETYVAEAVPLMGVAGLPSAGGVLYIRTDAFDSAAHPAPRRQWFVMLRGAVDIRVSTGESRRFGPGELLLLTDTTGEGHATATVGTGPFENLFIPIG
jgi:hypothetical protein